MKGGSARKLLVAAVLAVVIGAIVRVLRGGPAPAWTETRRRPPPPATEEVVQAVLLPVADVAPDEIPSPQPDPAVVASAPASSTVPTPTEAVDPPKVLDDVTWVPATGGACPIAYPVKANMRSGIFHVDGGGAYERTNADRCYRSAADAEADGLRASKR